MILLKQAATLASYLQHFRRKKNTVGFVPTMGALHQGHLSLIEKSKSICDLTVCSIFVNPTQFNDATDFEKYPVTVSSDILLLERMACNVLFLPSVQEIYPHGTVPQQQYDLGALESLLEGSFRPRHFQGVCQVVHRLLDIVQPDKLFLGRKDYQQCMVLKRLIESTALPVDIVIANTYREPTGLAMSSRNLRLNEKQKKCAVGISKMLQYIKAHYTTVPFPDLENYAKHYLLQSGFNKVDYVSIADADTLQPPSTEIQSPKLVALIAAFIGDVRLIDNMLLND